MYKTEVVKLYPNSTMKKLFEDYCNARNFYWNKALETWNEMYREYKKTGENKPSEYSVRKQMIHNKAEWEREFPSRILNYTVADLNQAWQHYLGQDVVGWGKPKFHSKKRLSRLGFKLDGLRFNSDGKLLLTKPHGYKGKIYPIRFRGNKFIQKSSDIVGDVSFFMENGNYYAAFTYKSEEKPKVKPYDDVENAVDLNVGRFTDAWGDHNILPKRLLKHYEKVKHYNRLLAKKRIKNKDWENSKTYDKTRAKLGRVYKKAHNLQRDIVKKYVHDRLNKSSSITIEDLNVKGMKMGIASKGLHRSLFGFFRGWLEYKSHEYETEIFVADRWFPSTQRCSCCGAYKTGDDRITLQGNAKHGTSHNEFICYECNFKSDRDENSVANLIDYKHLKQWSAVGTQSGQTAPPEKVRVGQCVLGNIRRRAEHQ